MAPLLVPMAMLREVPRALRQVDQHQMDQREASRQAGAEEIGRFQRGVSSRMLGVSIVGIVHTQTEAN